LIIEVAGTILASLGGASLIIWVFAHFLGKVWIHRIIRQTNSKYESSLEELKTKHKIALESFAQESQLLLEKNKSYSEITSPFYRSFFEKRIETYRTLLEIKNRYINQIEEDFAVEMHEVWGETYHSTYQSLRKVCIENQLYISNDLDQAFEKLRKAASVWIKEADMVETMYTEPRGVPPWEDSNISRVYEKLATETQAEMAEVLRQIAVDVAKIRSRIEVDEPNTGFNRTPESSRPAKPGELGGGAG
jgi:hypothetical protein